jgi:hypothetical protein
VVRSVRCLVDGQRPPVQRLDLGQAVGGPQQLRQVVEVAGDGGVVRAQGSFVDLKRAGEAIARFLQTTQVSKHAFLRNLTSHAHPEDHFANRPKPAHARKVAASSAPRREATRE